MASAAMEPYALSVPTDFISSVNLRFAWTLSQNWNKAHARRDYADAVKAADKKDPAVVKRSGAYQALSRIALIYKLEEALKNLTPQERLQERQTSIKQLVEEYFGWVKQQLEENVVPPKSKTAEGLRYSVNQEEYLKIFLTDGEIPIDNSASERAIRTFCIGKKNWLFHDSVKGCRSKCHHLQHFRNSKAQ